MKTLHLIRHAKSSWADPALEDLRRPLNKRGVKSCGIMAEKIFGAGCPFDPVFCSPARRARLTIAHIAGHLPDKDILWQEDDALYTFASRNLAAWCRQLDDAFSQVTIVGHNPAMTDFVNDMGDTPLDNLPTCAYARLTGTFSSWEELAPGAMTLSSFLKPKMFR